MDTKDFSGLRTGSQLPDPTAIDTTNVVDNIWGTYKEAVTSLLDELEAAAMQLEAGQEGLEMYIKSRDENTPYDFITLDINMPRLNGHETLEAIRQFENDHGIAGLDGVKIIMTTSEGHSKHIFKAFKDGCEAYVLKSNMGDKLLDEIAKLGLLKVVKVQKDYVVG